MTFFKNIGDGRKAVQGVFFAESQYTSAIVVQAYQRVNVGIAIGSQVSDILSYWNFGHSVASGAAISAPVLTASMSITLQRQYPEQMGSDFWHDVDSWSVTIAEGEGASARGGGVHLRAAAAGAAARDQSEAGAAAGGPGAAEEVGGTVRRR